ncbi:MAG TPA: cell division protein ZapB [Thermoanaerobaculia bacterium]
MAKKDQTILDGTAEGEILTRLTERVEKAVATIAQLRKEREELRNKLAAAEKKLEDREADATRFASAEADTAKSRAEREEIRNRIQRVLKSLEKLEEGGE